MKGNLRPSNILMLLNMRLRKFQINLQTFEEFAAGKFFELWWDWKESKEDDNDIDYDQVPLTSNSILLFAKIV